MKFRVWLKRTAADRVLAPLRKELTELIDRDSSLLEVGCGTGDLLFQSAHKIRLGYGVDLDTQMIEYAETERRKRDLSHLRFECIDALEIGSGIYDISTGTLCLHEMSETQACALLKTMVGHSRKVLIADYTEASGISGKLGIEIDELFSGHYRNFRNYRKSGEIPSYADQIGATIESTLESTIDGIRIWVIKGNAPA